jgi:hypothetical protein
MSLPASLRRPYRRVLARLGRVRAVGPSHPLALFWAGPYSRIYDAAGQWAPKGLAAFSGHHGPVTTLRAMEALFVT